ncbi:sugar phosphate isomerase/epimerase family protein [Paenibacillus shunpengii]|uniref:Sugar phosphate isomerase/epimerase family protein n=1 Tax=Paenibacillus shunpengii TaxID=2054424 RepID=A0ABW5SN61_9BACL|nr:sugar phosphate isomerase/epimerase family protein [Paenibacillus sp. PDC88]SDX56444.1 Sugar phosphate isomerase/epimerase [Paenibacillus sp. PDC88]
MLLPFKLCLNTSTLLPYRLGVREQIRIAAEAGYQGIELWVKDIDAYLEAGGHLSELRSELDAHGLEFANAIAFWSWADTNPEERRRGFELAEKELHILAELGCTAAAAPPYGNVSDVELDNFASSFAKLAELARGIGVEPYLEFWGKAKRLNCVKDAQYVIQASGVAGAKVLLDPFHMYTGGSNLEDLADWTGDQIGIVHVNDYPEVPLKEHIEDADRVFPGDGIAPSRQLAALLHKSGYKGYLSLELFKADYGALTALETAKLGTQKIKKAYGI